MPTITLTISINVPEGVTVNVDTITEQVLEPMSVPTVHITDEPIPAHRGESNVWSDEEDAILADTTLSHADLAELLGRTYHAVASRRYTLGIKTSDKVRVIREARRAMARWTEAEELYLREQMALDAADETIAISLGRSVGSVIHRRRAIQREFENSIES